MRMDGCRMIVLDNHYHIASSFPADKCAQCFLDKTGTRAIHIKCVRDAYRWTHNLSQDTNVNRSDLDFFRGVRALRPGPETICGFQKLEQITHGNSKWLENFNNNCKTECSDVDTSQFQIRGERFNLWKPDNISAESEKRNFENCSNCFMGKLGKTVKESDKGIPYLLKIYKGEKSSTDPSKTIAEELFNSCKACVKSSSAGGLNIMLIIAGNKRRNNIGNIFL